MDVINITGERMIRMISATMKSSIGLINDLYMCIQNTDLAQHADCRHAVSGTIVFPGAKIQ